MTDITAEDLEDELNAHTIGELEARARRTGDYRTLQGIANYKMENAPQAVALLERDMRAELVTKETDVGGEM